jgi:hypothetical protein
MADLAVVLKELEEERRSPGPSYPSNWQLGRTGSQRYTNDTEEAEAHSLSGRAEENFARAESTMGKGKAGIINIRATMSHAARHKIAAAQRARWACARLRWKK